MSIPPLGDPTLVQVVANQTQMMAMMKQQTQRQYHQQQMQVQIQAQLHAQNLYQSKIQYLGMQASMTPASTPPGAHQTIAPKSLSNRREASVVCDDCEEQGHCATDCPWKVYARIPNGDEAQCTRGKKCLGQCVYKKYGAPQSNPKKRRTIVWKMDDGSNMTITGTKFTPEDAARIPRRLRGNTFRGASQLTRHLRRYSPPKPECDEPKEILSDDDDGDDEILECFGEKERKLKACIGCEEVGHIASRCTQTCLCGEDTHLPDECPMRKVTCFLCEGTDHVPKDYQLNLVLAKSKEGQRTYLQPVYPPKADANNSTAPDLQPTPTPIEVISGSRSTANKVHESPLTPVSVMSVQLGHHMGKCPFPRSKKLVHRCFNCGETDHVFEGCPKPKRKHPQVIHTVCSILTPPIASAPTKSGLIQPKNTRKTSDNSRHLNVKLPPQRVIVKGTSKGSIVPPVTAAKLQNQHQQGKQCQENNSSPQRQRDSTLRQQCPQQVSPALVHKTTINFSNAPRVAPIQMSSNNSQIGDTKSKKVLPATTAKRIVTHPWRVSAQSNVSGETATSKQ
uniref:CCHC-type domain-containing protein n=1 Tax=Oryza punctata TaxID=4537 RepID=A0A0E0KNV2_ORYPU